MMTGAMTINVFCQTYGVGRTKTYDLLNAGEIQARKSGKLTLISRESAEHWYNRQPPYCAGRDITRSSAA
jgi:excisionase family DNA binding protein